MGTLGKILIATYIFLLALPESSMRDTLLGNAIFIVPIAYALFWILLGEKDKAVKEKYWREYVKKNSDTWVRICNEVIATCELEPDNFSQIFITSPSEIRVIKKDEILLFNLKKHSFSDIDSHEAKRHILLHIKGKLGGQVRELLEERTVGGPTGSYTVIGNTISPNYDSGTYTKRYGYVLESNNYLQNNKGIDKS